MAYDVIYSEFANYFNVSVGTAMAILAVISIWSLVWKGFALWKSAKKNSMIWFIVLLVVNTLGILEILYIYVFSKMGKSKRVGNLEKGLAKKVEKKVVNKKKK